VVCLHAWLRLEGNEPTVNFTEALDVEAKITKNGLAERWRCLHIEIKFQNIVREDDSFPNF
jgi:hypothetical protein